MQTQPAAPNLDPTAVMGKRIVAFIIDYAIGLALFLVLFFSIADSANVRSSNFAESVCEEINDSSTSDFCFNAGSRVWVMGGGDFGLILLVVAAYWFIFRAVLSGVVGYSLGKGVMGLRVVRQDTGELAGFGPNAVRWLVGIVDFGFCFLPGLITGLSSKGHRRVGDMAASTLVVEKSSVGVAPVIPGLTSPEVQPAPWTPPAPSTQQPDGSWASTPPSAPPTAQPAAPPVFPPPGAPPESGPPAYPPPTTPPLTEEPAPAPGADEPTTAMPAVGSTDPTETLAVTAPADASADAGTEASNAETEAPATAPEADVDQPAPIDPSAPLPERPVDEAAGPPAAPAPEPAPEPAPAQPGVSEPHWDEARNTYIQWDPELGQWMEWNEAQGRWIPIST